MNLNLPKNYTVLETETMMYLDGGNAERFGRNIYGLLDRFAVSTARRISWGIPSLLMLSRMSMTSAVAMFGAKLPAIASVLAVPGLGWIALAGGVAAVIHLWNVRVFY